MKCSIRLTAFLLCVFAVPFAGAGSEQARFLDSVNLLQNGSFETVGPSGVVSWKPPGTSERHRRHTLDDSVARDGTQSARLVKGDSDTWASWTQRVNVEGGRTYEIEGWVKIEGNAQVSLGVHFHNKSGKRLDIKGTGTRGETGWTRLHTEVTAPPGSTIGRFHCGVLHPGTVWFDDVSFSVKTATTHTRFEKSTYYPCMRKQASITLDGQLDDWRGAMEVPLAGRGEVSEAEQVFQPAGSWSGSEDLSGTMRLAWDGEKLYMCLDVTDDHFPVGGAQYWKGDSVQFGLDMGHEKSSDLDNNDYLLGLDLSNKKIRPVVDRKPRDSDLSASDIRAAVQSTQNGYTVECALPWHELGVGRMEPGGAVGLSLLINDNDGKGRTWVQWTPGLGHGKNPSRFGTLVTLSPEHPTHLLLRPFRQEMPNTKPAEGAYHLVSASKKNQQVSIRLALRQDNSVLCRATRQLRAGRGIWTDRFGLNLDGLDGGKYRITAGLKGAAISTETELAVFDQAGFLSDIKASIEKVRSKAAELRQQARTVSRNKDVDIRPERMTLRVAELFCTFAAADARDPDRRKLASRELKRGLQCLERARKKLQVVQARPRSREPETDYDFTQARLADGYFRVDGEVVFPGGYNQLRHSEEYIDDAHLLGSDFLSISLGTWLTPDSPEVSENRLQHLVSTLDRAAELNMKVDITLGHNHVPDWMVKKYPKIDDVGGHFVAYDIDHPYARTYWKNLLKQVIPRIADHPAALTYDLTNEASWHNCSIYGFRKFRRWLKNRYGTLNALNRSWGMSLQTFKDIDSRPHGTSNPARWFDWCRFNQHRVMEWFRFLDGQIKKYDPDALCHVKIGNENTFRGSLTRRGGRRSTSRHNNGIDREALMRLTEVNGCDTRPIHRDIKWHPRYNPSQYALCWLGQSICFDFQHSVAPNKPIFDTEWHSVQTVAYNNKDIPREHMRAALWLAYLHGLAGHKIWWWSRTGVRPRGKWFQGSLLSQPQLLDSLARTHLKIKKHADIVRKLVQRERPVRVLYSEPSAIQSVKYLDHQLATYEALHFAGVPVGFVTERMLQKKGVPAGCKLLVIPDTSYTWDATVRALQKARRNGTPMVVVGDEAFRYDEHGRERSEAALSFLQNVPQLSVSEPRTLLGKLEPVMRSSGIQRSVRCVNGEGETAWGVEFRTASKGDETLAYVINISSEPKTVYLTRRGNRIQKAQDLLQNAQTDIRPLKLKPLDVRLLQL